MTVEKFVEQVYLGVVSGNPSADVNIHRADIRNIVGAALDYAIVKDYYIRHNMAVRDRQVFGFSSPVNIEEPFLFTYQITPLEDTDRDLYYVPVPVSLLNIPGSQGVSEVFKNNMEGQRVTNFSSISDVTPFGTFFYWVEKTSSSEQRIYIKGLTGDCDVFTRLAANLSGPLKKTDEIPFPSGMEYEMIRELVNFFKGERNALENVEVDGVDDIAKKR